MAKRAAKKGNGSPRMMGFDYGSPASVMVMSAIDFNDNLRAGDIIACAYSEKYCEELDSVIPEVAIAGMNPKPIKDAFLQFKAWIDATGPDALKVEILFQDPGYLIGFGPGMDHLLWRTSGLEKTLSPTVFGLTYIKTIDSRNPLLERLVDYARSPIAPIYVTAFAYRGPKDPRTPPRPELMAQIDGLPEILLFNLPVYRTPEEIPLGSGLGVAAKDIHESGLVKSRAEYKANVQSPEAVQSRRERRMRAIAPATLHKLRTQIALHRRVHEIAGTHGLEIWQVEQAAINQRIWLQANPSVRYKLSRKKTCFSAVSGFIELDGGRGPDLLSDEQALIEQARRDLRSFLTQMGQDNPPEEISALQVLMRQQNFLTTREGA